MLAGIEEALRASACWRLARAEGGQPLPIPTPGRWQDAAEVSARLLSRLPRRGSRLGVLVLWGRQRGPKLEAAAQLFESASGGEIWRGRRSSEPGAAPEPGKFGSRFASSLLRPPNMDGGCLPRPELAVAPRKAASTAVPPAVASAIINLSNSSAAKRASAAKDLGQPDNQDAVLPLLKALDDADAKVRVTAADSLGKIGSPRAVNGLVELLTDPSPLLRMVAARALGLIGSDRARPGLKELLAVEKDPRARAEASDALKRIEDPMSLKLDVQVPEDGADQRR
jgi:hypothetical protein